MMKKIIRNIISWKEKQSFKRARIPTLQEAVNRKIDGGEMFYDMYNTSIGDLPWNGGEWIRKYQPYVDPVFSDNFPWDKDSTSSENVKQQADHVDIIARKNAGSTSQGVLRSNWSIKHGTIQVLAKMPNVSGGFSAIWMFDDLPEMDFEHCGQWKNQITTTSHWGYDYDNKYGKKSTLHNERKNKRFKPTEEYYLYEFELTPYEMIWRINGLVIRRVCEGVSNRDQHLIMSVGKGNYCGSVDHGEIKEDAVMSVKWVRTYKKA